jgi:hypothetical protein
MQIGHTYIKPQDPRHDSVKSAYERLIGRVYRKHGAERKRERFTAMVERIFGQSFPESARNQYAQKMRRKAEGLSRMAGLYFDEHGSSRGDHLTTHGQDYVPPAIAKSAPFFDSGRAGLGLVVVSRKRVYAKSSKWHPRETSTRYLVGRNEAGTFFAHAVPSSCSSVYDAISWIWHGQANSIIRRQGDIAVARGRGRRIPSLPSGHRMDDGHITHATHPTIAAPGRGEYLIVGKRAAVRVSNETRD